MFRSLVLALTALLAFGCQAPVAQAQENDAAPTPAADTTAAAPTPTKTALKIAKPAPKVPAGAVNVEVIPQFETLYSGDKVANLLVRLKGTGDAVTRRAPLDLALVIDRSGSMSGDKIRDVKTAALEFVNALSPEDTVTLISYSDDVQQHTTRLPADDLGKAGLRKALLGLRASGMTALGPAMMRALSTTEAGRRDDLRMAHVLLLSDGLANVGEKNPMALGRRAAAAFAAGVSVSTLGVGVDYNEDLMTKLADQGGGRYHFIKDSNAIAGVLDDEMKGLVATVARGMEISFRLADGTQVTKVFGYATGTQDGIVTSRVGALAAQQTREVVVRLALPAMKAGKIDLGQLSVAFKDVIADGVARRIDVPITLNTTDDKIAAQKSEHTEVTVRVAELEAADTLELAARAADRGDFNTANTSLQMAIDSLKRQAIATPSATLSQEIMDFEEAQVELSQARSSAQARKGYTKKFKARAYKSRKK